EASSLAGTQELSNLLVIWDDNRISIEDDTAIAFGEDTAARYAAYGWHVQHVDFTAGGEYEEDVQAFHAAVEAARADSHPHSYARCLTDGCDAQPRHPARPPPTRGGQCRLPPSSIRPSTVIAWPAPNAQSTGAAHGAALGEDPLRATTEILCFPRDASGVVDDE